MIFSHEPQEQWGFANKIAFRFIFAHITLYILLMFLQNFMETPMRFFAEYILHWGSNFKIGGSGSGDTTFNYVVLAFNTMLALIIGITWSILDRDRRSYDKLFYWFWITLRVVLFVFMALYGFAKVFKGQFPDPGLLRLLQPLGDMSPMGLAWTFMGFSFAYNLFIGFAEVLGGVLMLSRKTTTLGSMVIVGVMTNVAMMNFTYDIPVKLFSVHLILMAMVILMADGKRLVHVFFKNETATKVAHYAPSINTTLLKIMAGVKIFIVAIFTILVIGQSIVQFNIRDQLREESEFYGIWEAELFIMNNDTLPPLLTDLHRWRYFVVDQQSTAAVKKMDDSLVRYSFEINSEVEQITFTSDRNSIPQQFSYSFSKPDELRLTGLLFGDSLHVQLKKKPITDFRLINRGFNWVNESPFNR